MSDDDSETTDEPTVGDTYTHERTFTPEDVREFGDISGDTQSIHTDSDEEGRLVVVIAIDIHRTMAG